MISGCCGSIYNNVVGLSSISCFAFGPSCLHVTLAARPAKKRPKLRLVLIGQAATLEQQGDFAGMRVAQTHGFAHETADALKQNVARNCQETVCRILPGAAAMAPSESGADKAGETAQHAQKSSNPNACPTSCVEKAAGKSNPVFLIVIAADQTLHERSSWGMNTRRVRRSGLRKAQAFCGPGARDTAIAACYEKVALQAELASKMTMNMRTARV